MLQEYAAVIHAKGAPLDTCFGFVDGTIRPISRPGQHQRVLLQVFFSFADEMWLAKQATDINISFAFLYHVI